MVAVVDYDRIGSTFTESQGGNVWTRRFLIRDMENGPSVPDLYAEALAVLPALGAAAPAPISNMFVRDNNIERIWCDDGDPSASKWRANGAVVYRTPASSVGGGAGIPDDNGPVFSLSGSSSIVEIQTDLDISTPTPNQITTQFDNVTLAHEATTFDVTRSITVGRLEVTAPRSRKDNVEGRLNNATWNGYSAGTVLLSNLDWALSDDQSSYTVEYTFAIRDDWSFVAVHEDPFFPGRPLPNPDSQARVSYDVIPRANFGLLNITLP